MTSSARDVVYGRRGGRWAPEKPAKEADPAVLEEARARNAAVADVCRACFLPLSRHVDGDDGPCWEARARMAAAREHAAWVEEDAGRDPARLGLTLSALDREALDRHPQPTGWLTMQGAQT